MLLKELNHRTICILGFGKEGKATLEAIEQEAPDAIITIADKNPDVQVTGKHTLQLGDRWLKNLEKFDVIIASPGIPPCKEFDAVKDKLTNSTQIFLDEADARDAIVIGVTGSKGKSTTTSLIASVLKTAGEDVILAGNIGLPAIAEVQKLKHGTIVALEMSSYQLLHIRTSPHIAVLTSFFPEHLDYHGSLKAYFEAKSNIVRFQTESDYVIFNAVSEDTGFMALMSKGEKIGITAEECPMELSETKLLGQHNRDNLALAYAVSTLFEVSTSDFIKACQVFEPLPHRLQSLGIHHGIHWIDDAISTTPDSTIAALRALGPTVKTIILGGQDRGLEFAELAKEVREASAVETVILFPGTGPKIKEALLHAKVTAELFDADSMEKAVQIAKEKTAKNMTCLLSTASPSYNMFKNFEEKGEKFKEEILKK